MVSLDPRGAWGIPPLFLHHSCWIPRVGRILLASPLTPPPPCEPDDDVIRPALVELLCVSNTYASAADAGLCNSIDCHRPVSTPASRQILPLAFHIRTQTSSDVKADNGL